MKKYALVVKFAIRDQMVYIPSWFMKNVFFVIILFIFFSLWKAIFQDNTFIAGFTIVQTLWYLTFTEAIELSKSRIFPVIQEEVKDGSIAYALGRPYSYPLFHLAKGFGESLVRLLPILILGFIVATFLTGPLPGYVFSIGPGLLLLVNGIIIALLWQLLIGLCSFWMEEVSPLYWVLQKLIFILGGMFFPIDFFPEWLQGISFVLPFAFSAYWPAKVLVAFSWNDFLYCLTGQGFYILVLAAASFFTFSLGRRQIQAQGG